MNIICLDTIDSTNDEAKRRLRAAAALNTNAEKELFETAITARTQTAGKGRRGRNFHSPDTGDSLYISFILPPPKQHRSMQILTVAAAVAVCLSIEEILADSDDTTQRPSIKWVNDVLLDGLKICGILAEGVAASNAQSAAGGNATGAQEQMICGIVLGIGVNINMREDDFPEELRGIASSLKLGEYGLESFTEVLCRNMLGIYKDLESEKDGNVLDLYRKFESTTGRNIIVMKHVGGDEVKAFARAIADDGGLEVVFEDETVEVLRSGEISIRDCGA